MTKDDRGNLDLTKQIEIKEKETHALNDVVVNLKNIIDSKEAEMTAMVNANDSHREVKRINYGNYKNWSMWLGKRCYGTL